MARFALAAERTNLSRSSRSRTSGKASAMLAVGLVLENKFAFTTKLTRAIMSAKHAGGENKSLLRNANGFLITLTCIPVWIVVKLIRVAWISITSGEKSVVMSAE